MGFGDWKQLKQWRPSGKRGEKGWKWWWWSSFDDHSLVMMLDLTWTQMFRCWRMTIQINKNGTLSLVPNKQYPRVKVFHSESFRTFITPKTIQKKNDSLIVWRQSLWGPGDQNTRAHQNKVCRHHYLQTNTLRIQTQKLTLRHQFGMQLKHFLFHQS